MEYCGGWNGCGRLSYIEIERGGGCFVAEKTFTRKK
jgi:hypothetical protein